jgi:predicted outer membrane protein
VRTRQFGVVASAVGVARDGAAARFIDHPQEEFTMRLSYRMLVAAVVAVGLGVTPGVAAAQKNRSSRAPAPISAQRFLTQAAAGNQFEIVTGRLAQERAQADTIKRLGAEFVRDHTELLNKGSAVAARLGIKVPGGLTPEQQRTVARLQQLSGARFDREWRAAQIEAHQQALALHLRGAIRGKVAQIRTLALGGLPVVARHYGELLDLGENKRNNGDRRDDNGNRPNDDDRG